MLDRLDSERAVSSVYQTAAGTGSMKESDQRVYMRDLRRHSTRSNRRRSHKASLGEVAAIGIAVKQVAAKAA